MLRKCQVENIGGIYFNRILFKVSNAIKVLEHRKIPWPD